MARPSLTRAHRALLGVVAAGACVISGIGFAGSYNAVRELAMEKGFGTFAYAFPIGVDAGIVVLLALDLVLTWLRIPFPLLRQTAWLLTGATIAFNAAASWGDALGMAMHAVIPVLFVVVVEASRHAVGRIAAITADRHMESVRLMRWVLSPVPTFRLWRRMKLWELRSYDETVRLEQNRLVYRAQLRFRYGRGWRRSAPFQALLPLKLAKYGVPLDPSILDRIDGPLGPAKSAAQSGTAAQPVQAAHAGVGQLEAGHPATAYADPAEAQAQAQAAAIQAAVARATGASATGTAAGAAQVAEGQEPAVPGAAVSAAVAVPTLAKLAAVRLRDANDPAGEETPLAPVQSELNVWAARVVPTNAKQGGAANGARMPGQTSPWFKPPRDPRPAPQETDPVVEVPLAAVAGAGTGAAAAVRPTAAQPAGPQHPVANGPVAQGTPGPRGPRPVRLEQLVPDAVTETALPVTALSDQPISLQTPMTDAQSIARTTVAAADMTKAAGAEAVSDTAPETAPVTEQEEQDRRPAATPLDPDVCFEALIGYIDQYGHHPQPKRFAQYLSDEFGLVGSRPDGSVNQAEVDRIWHQLQDRYVASGRD
ncbi:DUF2637 domain-containing protein [Kitasatospora sp. NPDC001175]|uniref:DUF2637 domain-containing protein n=1 Tax=Kitasatospora sp. NPDC001175 TaxID=3157103 RepID=UPI003D06C78B